VTLTTKTSLVKRTYTCT